MDSILTKATDGVLAITLNRPEVLNSFNAAMATALLDALRAAAADPSVRAVLLSGNGRAFCAGQDPCAECFLLRGQAHAALGHTESALKDYNFALEKNPEMGIAYQQRGDLYRNLGRVEEAEKNFKRARELRE